MFISQLITNLTSKNLKWIINDLENVLTGLNSEQKKGGKQNERH